MQINTSWFVFKHSQVILLSSPPQLKLVVTLYAKKHPNKKKKQKPKPNRLDT